MRILLFAAALCATLSLTAQQRGGFYLSGDTRAAYTDLTDNPERLAYWVSNPLRRPTGLLAQSYRSGYFLTKRLLLGSRVGYVRRERDYHYSYSDGAVLVQPFVRYYFLGTEASELSLFGELGFGTIGIGDADGFETDFHLGLGAERGVAAGVLATANLNYNANASGTNLTDLTIGLNVLTGQLATATSDAPLAAGTLSLDGRLGTVAYGRNGNSSQRTVMASVDLAPRVGYFVRDGLLVEADLAFSYGKEEMTGSNAFWVYDLHDASLDLGVAARYYPLRSGRLLPYAGAGVSYLRSSERFSFGDGQYQNMAYRAAPVALTLGADFFLAPQVALDVAARYRSGSINYPAGGQIAHNKLRELQVMAGLRFFFGPAGTN